MKKILGLFKQSSNKETKRIEKTKEELEEIYGKTPDGHIDYYGDYSYNKNNYYN